MVLEGKKVLVTGLTGKIGAAIAAHFAPKCEMWGLARYSRKGAWEEAEGLGVRPIKGDMAGPLDHVPDDFDYVLNIAALISPRTTDEGIVHNCEAPVRLMSQCRKAKAFLHVSTVSVHAYSTDPRHVYTEESDLGAGIGSAYGVSKLAGEGAVRAAAVMLDIPTVICRQNIQYGGTHPEMNVFEHVITQFLETGEVPVPTTGNYYSSADYIDDIPFWVEPCLGVASVPATVVNWCADHPLDWREVFDYVGRLVGKEPRFVQVEKFPFPHSIQDPAKRIVIAGHERTPWKQGFRQTLQSRFPHLTLNDV